LRPHLSPPLKAQPPCTASLYKTNHHMKKLLTALLLAIASFAVQAQTKNIVISQVFGAGSLSGSPYSHDFIELYNPTDKPVSLAGWSVQYSPATNNRWSTGTVQLTGTMAPGSYFLIQLNGKEGIGKALPTPDLIAGVNVDISATSGKVALVNAVVALEGNCPVGSTLVDFIGFGTADCFETTAAPATGNTKSIVRQNNGCTDTDNNAADFVAVAPAPRNSSSPANLCNGATIQITSVSPLPFCIDPVNGASGNVYFEATGSFSNAQFKAVLSDATGNFTTALIIGNSTINGINPVGTIPVLIPKGLTTSKAYRIRVEVTSPSLIGTPSNVVEIINSAANVNTFTASPNADNTALLWTSPTGCFDEILIVGKEGASIAAVPTGNGLAYVADLNIKGSGSVFDGGKVVYKGTHSGPVVTGLEAGKEYFFKAFTRNGSYWSTGMEIKVKARLLPLPGEILINQLSPQYDSAAQEYIELVNTTGKTFDLSELSISVHAASGNKSVAGNTLNGMLQPHSYWLLSSRETVKVGKTTLPRDGHITDGISNNSSQIALLRKTDSTVIDGFGFGAIAVKTYTENEPASTPTSKGGFKRKWEGVDTDNNSVDFERVATADMDLRNSQSRLANTGAAIPGGNYTRLYVTGNAKLTGNVTITEKVVLQKGILQLWEHHLTTAKIEGGNAESYLQTNGSGTVTVQKVQDIATLIPVGNSTYNGVAINNGSGADWTVHVTDGIPHAAPFAKEKAVWRTWRIVPSTTAITGAHIQLQYNDEDAAQAGAELSKTEVQVWQYNSVWAVTGAPQKPAYANGNKFVNLFNWRQSGAFVIANPVAEMSVLTVLPIRFTDVKATELHHAVQINFTNATESDVAHYIIERSLNGTDFINIGTLQPLHNNGGTATYEWLDRTRPAGTIYYRIKGIEKDGKHLYSSILRITMDRNENAFSLFPNPVKGGQFTWQANLVKGHYVMQVTGSNGQRVLVKHFEFGGGNISETVQLPAGTPPGIYMLQITNGHYRRMQSFIVL
jgi:hypothetical protein